MLIVAKLVSGAAKRQQEVQVSPGEDLLREFVIQSNLIEDIHSPPGRLYFERHYATALWVAQSENLIRPKDLHRHLLDSLEAGAGQYRDVDVYVGRRAMPKHEAVEGHIRDWQSFVTERLRDMADGTTGMKSDTAWYIHHWFICIHPFEDGNGRVARLILNQCRQHLGLPWLVIKNADVEGYFAMIREFEDGIFRPGNPASYNAE